MLEQLQNLLNLKKSKAYYAERLSKQEGREVTVEEVEELMKEIKSQDTVEEKEPSLGIEGNTQKYNIEKGTYEVSAYYPTYPTPEQVILDHKIDETKWKLSAYYSKGHSKGFLVTALFKNISKEEEHSNSFQEFLKSYKSPHQSLTRTEALNRQGGTLLINKQDAHLNKKDINGENDIIDRFDEYYGAILETIVEARLSHNLEKIVYVVGSDQFNSEWTGMTTKGTPQSNILPYQVSFQLICNHEVKVINTLLQHAGEVEVVFLGGNHDQYVSWHMVSWLDAYYKNQENLSIDMSPDFTKFRSFYDSAVCLNHGDAQKQQKLASNFPFLYKDGFHKANFWYVITGDKHTEKTEQHGAVKCYQIPLQSKAVSEWDSKNGYTTSPAEVISFLFEEGKGIKHIIREQL